MTASGRTLAQLFSNKRIVICLGPGGVGKTTSAAAIAYAEASLSKRACVVTIDPARRLASALGLADLGNQATLVTKVGHGELWATMLDAHATFDDMVRKYATSTEQVDRILGNRLYQNLTTSPRHHQLTSNCGWRDAIRAERGSYLSVRRTDRRTAHPRGSTLQPYGCG